jgi:KaiC/GvpD/RAD55 family RecA-like ATPase/DNA-binding NarL/FixJ family response regulator
MLSTGIEALDSRLGGIEQGGHFLVLGPEGAGKSVLGMHFLIAGLEHDERCLLVTGNEPETVNGRGLFLGFSPGAITARPNLRVVDIHDAVNARGLAVQRHGPVRALSEIVEEAGGFDRIVVDDLDHFVRQSTHPRDVLRALARYVEEAAATSYLLASSDPHALLGNGDLEPVRERASAVIQLEPAGRGRRRFTFVTVRQRSFSTDPFLYTLRSGGGFAEDLPAYEREVDESLRKRIVVLDESQTVPGEVLTALSGSFDVDVHTDLDQSLIELLEAKYGVLVLGVDPYDEERAFNLTYTLRKSGNGAPILFIAPSRGLRSMTRSRGLRIGGDDFLLSEFPPAEIVERIRITAARGHHRRNGSVRADRHLQPTDEAGEIRPMTPGELQQTLDSLQDESPSPFFAAVVLRPSGEVDDRGLWDAVRPQLRLRDGDMVALLPDGSLAMILAQVDVELARKVVARVRRAHPALAGAETPVLLTSPLQEAEVERWARSILAVDQPS